MPQVSLFASIPGLLLSKVIIIALWLLLLWLTYRRGSPRYVLLGTIALGSLSVIFDMLPLARPYRLAADSDRMNQLSWTISLASGHNPFQFPISPQDIVENNPPFIWGILAFINKLTGISHLALVSYSPLLSTILLPVAYYFFAYRQNGGAGWIASEHRWAGLLMGASILFLTQNVGEGSAAWSFWNIQVLLKPDHVLAYTLLPVFLYLYLTERTGALFRYMVPGLLLGILIPAFIPLGAYVVAGLMLFALIGRFAGSGKRRGELKKFLGVMAIATMFSTWYWLPIFRENLGLVSHLMGAFDYFGSSAGKYYAFEFVGNPFEPYLYTPLLVGFALLGIVKMLRRFNRSDRLLLSFVLVVTLGRFVLPITWVLFNFKPFAYQTPMLFKLAMGIAAGIGILFLAEIVYTSRDRISAFLAPSRALRPINRMWTAKSQVNSILILLLLLTPFFTPVWRLAIQDEAWHMSREPIPRQIVNYTQWVSNNTDKDAAFLADRVTGYWINGLTGRLMVTLGREVYKPKAIERHNDAAAFYATTDLPTARSILAKYNVSYVVVSPDIIKYYQKVELAKFGNQELFQKVYQDGELLIYSIKPIPPRANALSLLEENRFIMIRQ